MTSNVEGGRPLKPDERRIVQALLSFGNSVKNIENARVIDMNDGEMGSIRFVGPDGRRRSRAIAEAQYLDQDSISVSIELNVDEENELFELDFWKADFSPLRRYPAPHDLTNIKC